MSAKRSTLAAAFAGLSAIAGCPTGAVVGTLLALSTFTFLLGQTGVIDVQAGSSTPARTAGVFSLDLDGGPADEPDSARMNLGTVRAIPLDDTAKAIRQGASGIATITVYCAAATSSNPCSDGVLVGDFVLHIDGEDVERVTDELPVPAAALPFVISGEFAVCLEVTATLDVRIIIEDMSVSFGEDTGAGPDPVDGTPNPNDGSADPGDGTPADTTAPTFATCPETQQAEARSDGIYVLGNYVGLASASDDSGSVEITQDPPSGSVVEVGTTAITLTATDPTGNTATCSFDVDVAVGDGGYIPALVTHGGSEHIIAGSDIDPAFGLKHSEAYSADSLVFDRYNNAYALSGFGTRVWFRLLAPFSVEGQDRTQIWSINVDGTGAMRTPLPAELSAVYGCHVETNEDGNVCIVNMDSKIHRANPTGDPLEMLYDFDGQFDFRGAYKVDNPGERCWLVDLDGRGIHSIDLNAIPYFPTTIITRENQAINGRDPRALAPQEFDLAGDFPAYVFRRNYDLGSTVESAFRFQDVFWFGSGLVAPASLDNIIQVVSGRETPYSLNISDDGLTFAYCQNVDDLAGIDPPVPCFVETVEGDVTMVGDGRTRPGGLVMSDNGARVFYVDSASLGGSNPIIEDVATGRKVAAGTPAFSPRWDREFVRVDDIGRNFLTSCEAGGYYGGLYVLSDGAFLRENWPQIGAIGFRFDDECTLRVRASVTGPRGIAAVRMWALNDGVPPTEFVPGEDNPFYAIRGNGVTMTEREDVPGLYEYVFDLTNSNGDCARDKLTSDFVLRIFAIDANETVTVYKDFTPAQ